MKLIFEGKTKDVYEDEKGNIVLKFKDTVTGKDGVFDPGANEVALSIDGMGNNDLKLSKFFFEKVINAGINTHYIDCDLSKNQMTVKKAKVFGKGIEVILRYKAVGSFIRRYGAYIEDGADLNNYVEITLKDDQREDPLITKDALIALNILKDGEYEKIKDLTIKIAKIIKDELSKKGLTLYDLKFEFGKDENGEIMLIDELSAGNMRVYNKDKKVEPLDLGKIMLG